MAGLALDSRIDPVVGARTAKALDQAFEIRTVRELLWHFPRRYSNRGELTPLTDLPLGEHVSIVAQVIAVRERSMQRRRGSILEVEVTDGVGRLQLTFFNQKWRAQEIRAGRQGIFAGKVSRYRDHFQLQHPDYLLLDEPSSGAGAAARGAGDASPGGASRTEAAGAPDAAAPGTPEISIQQSMQLHQAAALAYSERPIPIYPATAKVASWTVQKAVELVLDALDPVPDPLPEEIRERVGAMRLAPSLELIHRPERSGDWQRARESMRFREAFDLQLAMLDRRRRAGLAHGIARPAGELLDAFDAALPFELTGDQRRVGQTIAHELAQPHPMHRLLQGDVGSGKTLVALRAMLQVTGDSRNGGQSALLAPTEVLAAQHFRSITEALGPALTASVNPVLLTGRMPASERKRALLSVASGNAGIVVGTHALMGDSVSFYDLGLVVIDEQHRFGVDQREALRRKGTQPHVLAMTATPIPRTVALTVFGDLEVSTIHELPPGRQGIETFQVPELEMPNRAARVWQRAAEDLASGRQIYVVCPAISAGEREEGSVDDTGEEDASDAPDASDTGPIANVVDTIAELRSRPEFADATIAGLHGGMGSDEKDRVMRAFSAGEIGVLVATTVIEVGVNVPNASIMIVRDADRFGISQLHQLRGRVGRGEHAGLCLLLTKAPPGSAARSRIEAVEATSDGFALAEIDLELRREGDILGTAQSGGRSTLRLLRVARDGEVIEQARIEAGTLLEQDPDLGSAPLLADQIARETENLENLAKS